MHSRRRLFGWACPSASRRRGLPFTVSRLRVDAEAAVGRDENHTYRRPATPSLPTLRHKVAPVRLLVDFEPLGGCAVEFVAGVSCTDLSHKPTCVRGQLQKKKKKKRDASGKRSSFGKSGEHKT